MFNKIISMLCVVLVVLSCGAIVNISVSGNTLNEKKIIANGLVDDLSTYDTSVDWNAGSYYAKPSQNPESTKPAIWVSDYFTNSADSQIKGLFTNYWNGNAPMTKFLTPYDYTADFERSLTYRVKGGSYLGFSYFLSNYYSITTLREIIFDNNNTGFQVWSSPDNGTSWSKMDKNSLLKFEIEKKLNPWLTYDGWPSSSGDFFDFIKNNDANWYANDIFYYLQVGCSVKLPDNATMVKIVLPKKSTLLTYNKTANADPKYNGWTYGDDDFLYNASLVFGTVKASRTPITTNDKGDSVAFGDYIEAEISSKDSLNVYLQESQNKILCNAENYKLMKLSDVKNSLNLKVSDVKFFNGANEIQNLDKAVENGIVLKHVSKGMLATPDGTLIKQYTLGKGKFRNPVISTYVSKVSINSNNKTIFFQNISTEKGMSFHELTSKLFVVFGEIGYQDAHGVTIDNLDNSIKSGDCLLLITKNAPGQKDGVVTDSFKIVTGLLPGLQILPKNATSLKLPLKVGVADRCNLIQDENKTYYTAYGQPDDRSLLQFTNPAMDINYGNYLWLGNANTIDGVKSICQYQMTDTVKPDMEMSIHYNVQSNTYAGAVFYFNTSMPSDIFAKCLEDVKMFTSADNLNWTEISHPYKGSIGGTYNLNGADLLTVVKESDNNGRGINSLGNGWTQVLYCGYIPRNHQYLKIKFPNSSLIKQPGKMYDFTDASKTQINYSVAYEWCNTHSRWDTGDKVQGLKPAHSLLLYGGRLVASDLLWSSAVRLGMVKLSSIPMTLTSFGSYEYMNDYDASEVKSKDNLRVSLYDNNLYFRSIDDDKMTLGALKSKLQINFSTARFYTNSSLNSEITDLQTIATDEMYMQVKASGNLATEYFPDGFLIGNFRIKCFKIKSTDFPAITSNNSKLLIDNENKTVRFTYYADEGAGYNKFMNSIQTSKCTVKVFKADGNELKSSDDFVANAFKIVLFSKGEKSFIDGTAMFEYQINCAMELKKIGIVSKNNKLIECDELNSKLIIRGNTISINKLLKNIYILNSTIEFSKFNKDGAIKKIVSFNGPLTEDMYVDVYSAIDDRFISYQIRYAASVDTSDNKPLYIPLFFISTLILGVLLYSKARKRIR